MFGVRMAREPQRRIGKGKKKSQSPLLYAWKLAQLPRGELTGIIHCMGDTPQIWHSGIMAMQADRMVTAG